MRVLEQLAGLIREVSSDFPWGAIINETDTQDGTAVVREVYNDLLVNVYKLLDITGQDATGNEDSESNGYQLVEALKRLPNELNDIEQILTLSGTTWSVPLYLSRLPNKYVFFARVTDDYIEGQIEGLDGVIPSYNFTSAGFSASDEIMVVLDTSGARAYKIGGSGNAVDEVFTVMGIPVAFNDQPTIYYQEQGAILSDMPKADYLESVIRVDESDASIILTDIFVMQGYVLCACFVESSTTYKFFQFPINDFSDSTPVNILSGALQAGTDYKPYFYADESNVYITNDANDSVDDNSVVTFEYDGSSSTLNQVLVATLDGSFVKTSNGAVKNNLLYTYVNGLLASFNLTTGVKAEIGTFNGLNGNLFTYNGQIYFTGGEVAKLWV